MGATPQEYARVVGYFEWQLTETGREGRGVVRGEGERVGSSDVIAGDADAGASWLAGWISDISLTAAAAAAAAVG